MRLQTPKGWIGHSIQEFSNAIMSLGQFAKLSIILAAMGEVAIGVVRPEGAAYAAICLVLGTLFLNLLARIAKLDD
jgi:hypothetical protein